MRAMQLLELITQGVAGHPAEVRWRPGPGHVVVRSAVPLLPLLRAVLFFDGIPGDGAERLAARRGARVALTLRGRDGAIHRIVRDLEGGTILQRLVDRRFETISRSALEIGPFLRSQIGFPSRGVFETLFARQRETAQKLAAWQPRAPAGQQPAAPQGLVAPAAWTAPAAPVGPIGIGAPALSPEEKARAIARLEEELAAVEASERLQSRLEEVLHDQAAAEREAEAVRAAQERVAELERSLARFAGLGSREEIRSLLDGAQRADEEREAALRRIEAEREEREARMARLQPAPWEDWRFWTAAGVGVASLAAGILTPWRILAFLDVPAFGVASVLALGWVSQLQRIDSASRFETLQKDRERKVEARWHESVAALRERMERFGVEERRQLLELAEERDDLEASLREARRTLEGLVQTAGDAAERLERLAAEARRIEEELGRVGAGAYRPRSVVAAELAALRGEAPAVAAAVPLDLLPPTPLPMAPAMAAPGPGPAAGMRAADPPDPCLALLEQAADLLAVSPLEIAGRAAERATAHLARLGGEALGRMELSPVAGTSLHGVDGTRSFADLAPAERELVHLALQAALVEGVGAKHPVPFVLDDPFGGWDERRQERMVELLGRLGRRLQILHRTGEPSFASRADQVLEA